MTARSVDRAVEGYARRQHGVFHHRQALRIGATPGIIRRRLASGTWIRLADSLVYGLPSHPGTWHRQCTAATLSVPVGAVSGASGAALLKFDGFRPGPIEVATHAAGTHQSPFATVRRSGTVGRFTTVDGIRVVSRADCAIQLAGLVGGDRLEAIVGDQAHSHRRFLDDLRDRYVDIARSRLPGIGNLRAVLAAYGEGVVPPRNQLEQKLRLLLSTVPNLPEVEFEATPPWYEPGEARVDALVPDWRLIVEGDGRAWHTRVGDFERDRERDNLAIAHGYRVLRFTHRALEHEWARCRRLLLLSGTAHLGPIVVGQVVLRA
jgi:hypothetical protein